MNILFIVLAITFVSFIFWMYLLNIYEVKFYIDKSELNGERVYRIYPKLLNSFGMQIPFRQVAAEYVIQENQKKLQNIKYAEVLYISTKNQQKLEIICSTKFNLFPEKIILYPN